MVVNEMHVFSRTILGHLWILRCTTYAEQNALMGSWVYYNSALHFDKKAHKG